MYLYVLICAYKLVFSNLVSNVVKFILYVKVILCVRHDIYYMSRIIYIYIYIIYYIITYIYYMLIISYSNSILDKCYLLLLSNISEF